MNAERREEGFVESAEKQLLDDIKKLVGQKFVYEDGWCGMVPFDGQLNEMQTGPPVLFAALTWREQADVLREFIHWDNYPARDWHDEYLIKDNIAAGKPSEQWLEGTSLHESFRLLAKGKTPPPPKECPQISEQELRAALAEAAAHASGPQATEGHVTERASAAQAFQDIFRNDQPREAETKTQEWSGWEV
jgi:hypothetical protein